MKLRKMSTVRSLKMTSSHSHGLAWRSVEREAEEGEAELLWMGLSSFRMSVERTPLALSFLSETCFSEKKKKQN